MPWNTGVYGLDPFLPRSTRRNTFRFRPEEEEAQPRALHSRPRRGSKADRASRLAERKVGRMMIHTRLCYLPSSKELTKGDWSLGGLAARMLASGFRASL